MTHWATLEGLENAVREKLGWSSQQIAVATENDLRAALQSIPKKTTECEDEPFIVLEHRFVRNSQQSPNAVANSELLGLLIAGYCTLTSEPVTAASFEQALFSNQQ